MLRLIIFIQAFIFSAGCAVQNVSDGYQLKTNEGFALFRFASNWDQREKPWAAKLTLFYSGTQSGRVELNANEEIKILALPAGVYTWKKVTQGQRYLSFTENSKFEVKKGTVSYIGDVYIDFEFNMFSAAGAVYVQDKSDLTLSEFSVQYDYLSKKYSPIVNISQMEIK